MSQTITYYVTGSAPDMRRHLREKMFGDPKYGSVVATVILVAITDAKTIGTPAQVASILQEVVTKDFNLQNVTVRAVTSD